MITKIAIENFKGIGERVEVELRPLTLLFGNNRRQIHPACTALRQGGVSGGNLDADRTVAGGELVRLGGFRNFVHGRDLNREVRCLSESQCGADLNIRVTGTRGEIRAMRHWLCFRNLRSGRARFRSPGASCLENHTFDVAR